MLKYLRMYRFDLRRDGLTVLHEADLYHVEYYIPHGELCGMRGLCGMCARLGGYSRSRPRPRTYTCTTAVRARQRHGRIVWSMRHARRRHRLSLQIDKLLLSGLRILHVYRYGIGSSATQQRKRSTSAFGTVPCLRDMQSKKYHKKDFKDLAWHQFLEDLFVKWDIWIL